MSASIEELRAARDAITAISAQQGDLYIEATEYAVRYTLPGERQRIDPVGDPDIAADFIHELHMKHGVTGVLVTRQITAWEDA